MSTFEKVKTKPEYIYLTTLLTTTLLIHSLDKLQNTPYYKRELKQKANTFLKELESISREDVHLICDINNDNLYKLMDYVKEGINEMAALRPEDIGIVSEIMRMYREEPDKVLQALQIQLVDNMPSNS